MVLVAQTASHHSGFLTSSDGSQCRRMVYLKREVCPVSASLLFPISGRAALALDPSAGSEQPQPDQALPQPAYQLGGMFSVSQVLGQTLPRPRSWWSHLAPLGQLLEHGKQGMIPDQPCCGGFSS